MLISHLHRDFNRLGLTSRQKIQQLKNDPYCGNGLPNEDRLIKELNKIPGSLLPLKPYAERSGEVWRLDNGLGSLTPGETPYDKAEMQWKTRQCSPISDDARIIVMDFDSGWSQSPSGNDSTKKNYYKLAENIGDHKHLIRCHDPKKEHWKEFRKKTKKQKENPGLWACLSEDIAGGALRHPGTWKKYREFIVQYFKDDSTLWDRHKKCFKEYIVIRIDYDGILLLGPELNTDGVLSITLGSQPGSFLRNRKGHVTGSGVAFIGEFVPFILKDKWNKEDLINHSKNALVQSQRVLELGYKSPDELILQGNRWMYMREPLFKYDKYLNTRAIEDYKEKPCISFQTCAHIVCGYESDYLRNIRLKMGKFATADEECAQTLLNVEYRIRRHVYDGEKVISFGIFGEPGCGKSFLAKQLAESTNNEDKPFEIMTFNLSQFSGKDDLLTEAFRTIREKHMQGKIPFVLFDEFDTAKNGDTCGWLTSFLMPMQDGKFFDGKDTNELGKCIFFFMGGVFESVEEFREWMECKETEQEAKKLKAPDFHSRLESVISIPSVKLKERPKSSIYLNDLCSTKIASCVKELCKPLKANWLSEDGMLMRAILLRSYFKKLSRVKLVHGDVLNYLLRIPLRHGARSLEKIVKASSLDTTEEFLTTHLPSRSFLQQHIEGPLVDPEHYSDLCAENDVRSMFYFSWHAYKPKRRVFEECLSKGCSANSWQTRLNTEIKNVKSMICINNVGESSKSAALLSKKITGFNDKSFETCINHLAECLATQTFKQWKKELRKAKGQKSLWEFCTIHSFMKYCYKCLPDIEKQTYLDAAYEAIFDHIDSISGRKSEKL